jgi:hypothetical protein
MRDADRFKLLGSYRTPRVRLGTVLSDEVRDDDVIVVGYSDGRIPWPVGRRRGFRGRGGLVVYGRLADAVRTEAGIAVAYWFGVNKNTVSAWRRALGVERTTAGTRRLRRAYGAEEWFARVRAKGHATPWTEERRANLSARFKGRKYGPQALANIRAGLRRRKYKRHPPEVRAKLKAAAAARLARGEVPNGRAWTPAEDALVRAVPVREAARRTKRTVTAVYKRRRKLGVADGRRAAPGPPH